MPITLQRLIDLIEELAPPELAEPWDNVGLQVGAPDGEIDRVLLTVDVTKQVVAEAARKNVSALLSHHPLLFDAVASLRRDRWPGCVIVPLIEERCALYVAHTNLDWAPRANTSSAFAHALGFDDVSALRERTPADEGGAHLGVVAECDPMPASDVADSVKAALGLASVRVSVASDDPIAQMAIVAGSAKGLLGAALEAGAHLIVAGEIGHHPALEAAAVGVSAIEVGHSVSERAAMERLADYLREAFGGDIEVLLSAGDTGGLRPQ